MVVNQSTTRNIPDDSGVRYIGRIPVRNIWFLMLYASGLLRLKYDKKIDIEKNPEDIADLVAEILAYEVKRRLKRNPSSGYQPQKAWLGRVRGRIDLLATERHQLLNRGQVACRFEDLTVNTPRNRLVKAALRHISFRVENPTLSRRCRILANTLKRAGVQGEKPSRNEISLDRFGRHDSEDQLMVAAAKLAFNLALPTEDKGEISMKQPDCEDRWIRHLYEQAIYGFYKVELSSKGWEIGSSKIINWQIEKETPMIKDILPGMEMDTVLENHITKRRIVIDTKFNSIVTKGWYREKSLRSANIYQIYAYLRSQEGKDDLAEHASGLLLHPSVGETICETVLIQGHAIKFATVDLTKKIPEIRKQLLNVIVYPDGFC